MDVSDSIHSRRELVTILFAIFLAAFSIFGISLVLEKPQDIPTGDIIPERGNIILENANYYIESDLGITGYSPVTGKNIMEMTLMSKGIDRSMDVAVISPEPFQAGSKALIYTNRTIYDIRGVSRFCNSSVYGWQTVGEVAYCSYTWYDENASGYYQEQQLIPIDGPYWLETTPNNATINWNRTFGYEDEWYWKDISANFNHVTRTTPYGDEIYYITDQTFKADKKYQIRIETKIDEQYLPLKYSITFGDIQAQQLYYILDPTIVNSKTWTTDGDWNDTLTNLTMANNQLELDTTPNTCSYDPDTIVSCFDFSNDTTDYLNRYDGTASGTPTYAAGVSDSAIYCDASDDKILIPNGVLTNTDYTFISRVKYDNTADGDFIWSHAGDSEPSSWFPYWSHDSTNYVIWMQDGTLATNVHIAKINGARNTTSYQLNGFTIYRGVNYTLYKEGVRGSYTYQERNTGASWFEFPGAYNRVFEFCVLDRPTTDIYYDMWIDLAIFANATWTETDHASIHSKFTCAEVLNCGGDLYTTGVFSDRQGWSPQTGNTFINMTLEVTLATGSSVLFRYNATNASLDSSQWVNLTTNGTNVVTLDMSANDAIFYEIKLVTTTTESPKVTSNTLYEATLGTPYFRGTFSEGITSLRYSVSSLTAQDVEPTGQTAIKGVLNITNYGDGAGSVCLRESETYTGVTTECAPNYFSSGLVNLTTSFQAVISSLAANGNAMIWCRRDYANPTEKKNIQILVDDC